VASVRANHLARITIRRELEPRIPLARTAGGVTAACHDLVRSPNALVALL
jgi:hypothetical protein